VRILVKLGGALLDEDATREALALQIATIAHSGLELVVVHGGGKQMTRFLTEKGVESRFVNGLRVTTPEILDAVLKVFAGTVNHQLVAALNRAGARAVGLSGVDANLVEAEQMDPALGWVGRVTQSNPDLLHVNADQMAVACAVAYGADRLIFLTDVDGVLDKDKHILAVLSATECARLVASGVATGGMQAKLEAAAVALQGGVSDVRITAGKTDRILERILSGEQIGTRLSAREAQIA
jgi:acetylglutamate kinase